MALSLLILLACGDGGAPPQAGAEPAGAPAAKPSEIDVSGLKTRLDQGPASVIDVRTPEEYALGHVPGAVNIPLGDLPDHLAELDAKKTEDLYLICAVGGRSAQAAKLLASNGFTSAINVTGGTNAWAKAGLPLQ